MHAVAHFLMGYRNDTLDFSKPHLRPSFATIYPLFVFLYALLITSGVVANIAMIASIIKDKLYRDQTYCYLINIAIANIVECVLVLPISLTILLVQNWIFGSFLCYFLPMLQDIPLHVSTLTLLLIAWDRHRFLKDPMKPRIPAFVCATGSWLTGICLVLPYPIYTTYLDLGKYLVMFKGVGLCAVNLQDHIQEYTRGLFIALYVLPLGVTAYLYIRMSHLLQDQEGPLPVMYEGVRPRTSTGSHDFRNGENHMPGIHRYRSNHHELYEAELDIRKEKRTHKYLGTIAAIFGICLCPLMILRVVKLALVETYDNSGHFDITYTMFVWIAFLPTTTTPALYAAWRMSRTKEETVGNESKCARRSHSARTTKERLRGYLRLSGRNRSRSSARSDESSGIPPRVAYSARHSEAGLSQGSAFNNS